MAAIPPVLAATAPAPENFRSLRRSIRAMVFPPYHPEAFRCIGGSLKPTAAWHKPAPPNWWGRRLKGQVELLGFSPLWLGVLLRSTFERVGFEPSVPRWDAPPKDRFATDPALEERGFEPSVPSR